MEITPLRRRHRNDHEPLVTFAVIADSHMNPEDDASTSPWEVNRLANARATVVVSELNALAPDFVVHLGDMIHPVPAQDSYCTAAARFWRVFGDLAMPLHVVPGNHDVGDKPLEWTPAAVVTEEYVELYEREFGASHYSFSQGGCAFVVLNAQLFNTGFEAEHRQRDWLETTLAENAAAKTFVFLHYPPYVYQPEENGHYDNLDEPGRSWLLELLREYGVDAVFAGHVHNFFYDHRAGTDFYILPSISFVRSDYSEFARIGPEDADHGRNDVAKLGYLLVEVYDDDHRPIICRTYGRSVPGNDRAVLAPAPRQPDPAPVGVDLRHSWADVVQIPYSGGLDEFDRKSARNDYPLMALWELGITNLRLPLSDLADPHVGERARVLGRNGHRFVPFVFGLPGPKELDVLRRQRDLVTAVEVILPGELDDHVDQLAGLRAEDGLPIWVSKLRGHDDITTQDGRYFHVLNHGYLLDEADLLPQLCGTVDGIVFRIGHDLEPAKAIRQIAQLAESVGVQGVAHIRFAGEVPAEARNDEVAAANRLAEILATSVAHPGLEIYLDSFVDQDRGYFPRTGLLDRRFNPRLAGRVFRNLRATLLDRADVQPLPAGATIPGFVLSGDTTVQMLLLPSDARELTTLAVSVPERPSRVTAVDLGDGLAREIAVRSTEHGLQPEWPLTVSTPTLVEFPLSHEGQNNPRSGHEPAHDS